MQSDYKQFEDHFRGSRAEIIERLGVYKRFVSDLAGLYPEAIAVDLGCGRGEWLEILNSLGIKNLGIDNDDSMLEESRRYGLNVEKHDALSFLQKQPNETISVLSAFQLVEHLPENDLNTLIAEADRVLKPHGVLVLETPNPENIYVATNLFYNDPTHVTPITPGYLFYLMKARGFEKIKTVRLREKTIFPGLEAGSILQVISGVSPDYAMVAQKKDSRELAPNTAAAFDGYYGMDPQQVSAEYDRHIRQLGNRLQSLETIATEAAARIDALTAQVNTLMAWHLKIKNTLVGRVASKLYHITHHGMQKASCCLAKHSLFTTIIMALKRNRYSARALHYFKKKFPNTWQRLKKRLFGWQDDQELLTGYIFNKTITFAVRPDFKNVALVNKNFIAVNASATDTRQLLKDVNKQLISANKAGCITDVQ